MVYPLLLAIVVMIAPDDAHEAVAKLASPRSAVREAAQRTLESLGDAAFPALAAAADSPDLELRHTAAVLLDTIEGRRLARPTMVTLDFVDRPLLQVVQAISRSAGVTIVVEPDGDARARTKAITLKAETPVPLWEALDRLARAAGLRLEPGTNVGLRQRQMFAMNAMPQPQRRRVMVGNELVLRFDDGESPTAPVFDAGALRVTVASIVLNRNRTFVRTPANPGTPETTAVFTVGLQVRAEPHLTIAALEDSRLIEVRDDRGQSLLAGPPSVAGPPIPWNGRGFDPSPRNPPLVFALKYPAEPGQKITRLRGSVRALVVGRRGEPLTIPLVAAAGKTFSAGSSSVLVHAVRTAADGRETTIEFTLDTAGGGAGSQPILNPLDPRSGLRPPPAARGQVEFFDAKGQLCHTVDLATTGMGFGSGGRTTVMIQPPPGTGPPTSARYYAATWAAVDVSFDFRDVPMP